MLTDTHQQLIRGILKDMTVRSKITAEQRAAIRQCCIDAITVAEPEKVLVAFKSLLAVAADAEGITPGFERNALLSQLISIFIDELYASGDDAIVQDMGLRKETPASAPRIFLENDSIDTHL